MSTDRFPERIDPKKIFARQGSIVSAVPLCRFARLEDYLSNSQGEVAVSLQFGHDASGRRQIRGVLRTQVHLQCQRCLEDLVLDLDVALDVLVLASDAAARALPGELEAVVVEDGEELALLTLVEDELILNLPIVPLHDEPDCNPALEQLQQASAEEERQDNPFAKLRALKLDKDGRSQD